MTRWPHKLLACALLCMPVSGGLIGCSDDDNDNDGSGNMPRDATVDRERDAAVDGGNTSPDGQLDQDAQPTQDAQVDGAAPAAGDTYALTSANRLLSLQRASGQVASAVAITGIPSGETLLGGDIRPANGKLYALSSAAKLYTIDLATGVATLASTLKGDDADATDRYTALAGTKFGVDFNPVPDRLRVISDQGQNLRINVDNGNVTTDGVLNPATPGATAAGYTNSFAAACRTKLFVVDTAGGNLLLQDPPNDGKLTVVGALGGDSTQVTSFEIASASDGKQHAFIVQSSAQETKLWDVDLSTGAASNARAVALQASETVLGLASPPPATAPTQEAGELIGLNDNGALISFNRAAPGKLCTSTPVTNLPTDVKALGMDVRPADGAIYVLASDGKIYTADLASGAMTLKSTLTSDEADVTDKFTALDGQELAVGFNPVPDRLRVISRAGLNLRINVNTGATTTDAVVSGANVTALGYTGSFAGATSTALYALDTQADTLVRIGSDPATTGGCPGDTGNPNCGVATSIGALGIGDVSDINGFDLDAIAGTALAALSVGNATSSTLYAINLTTGAAALPAGTANGTIGGGAKLRGLAFRANPPKP